MNMPGLCRPALAVAVCAVVVNTAAHAQINPFGRQYSRLSEEDLRLLFDESEDLLEEGKQGSVASWSNETTGNFGTMELEKVFEKDGIPCRSLDHIIKAKNEQDPRLFRLTYCRIGNEWKLAQ